MLESVAYATVATDLNLLGNALKADLIGWGSAVIGVSVTAMAIVWVMRLIRS